MEQKRTCPECNLIFEATQPESGFLTCPLCNTAFSAGSSESEIPPVVAAPVMMVRPSSAGTSGRHVLKGCVAVGALVFLVGGLGYAYHRISGVERKNAASPSPAVDAPSLFEAPWKAEPLPVLPIPPPLEPIALAPRSPQRPTEVQVVSAVSLADRINHAIDRGVEYLRKNHSGHDQYRNYLGLLGLTLLECGATHNDPTVKQIAAWLRGRKDVLANTYELALAILFFDRLDDPQDRTLIRTFGQRLLAGQLEGGTWTYSCPVNDNRRRPPGLSRSPQIISRRNSMPFRNAPERLPPGFRGDNSNTQFAILGLWVAQRHGVFARRALLSAEQCFRETQRADGSWSYHPRLLSFRDSMTCAGLMCLAMRHGMISGQGRDIRPDNPVEVRDAAVTWALRFLGQSLNKVSVAESRITGVEARDPLYFLWSLERMAMIYDLTTVGDKEWYPWAARMLVGIQQPDGSWHAPYSSPIGTCFALLVLKRSNVAHDLQLAVQGQPPRRPSNLTGPTIIQGPNAALGLTTTKQRSGGMPGTGVQAGSSAPLGPTTIQSPNPKPVGKRPDPPNGVLEIPNKK